MSRATLSESEPASLRSPFGLPHEAAFIFLANASWDSSSRVNCHHIALRVSEAHRVLFVESIGARTPSLTSGRDLGKVWRRIRSASHGLRRWSPGLAVLSPLLIPGFGTPVVDLLNARLVEHQIRGAAAEWLGDSPVVLWVFTPAFAPVAARLNSALRVYQCVDEHAAYPGVPSDHITTLEEHLIRHSDITLTTSRALFESRSPLGRSVVCLPNVADTAFFERAMDPDLLVPRDVESFVRPIVGFVGNVSGYKVDCTLLRNVADRNPTVTFLMIGEIGLGESSTSIEELRHASNIHLLGPRDYADLPSYLKGFDVCMIPFAFTPVTEKSLPMKLFEYMASGRPIVATATRPLLDYADYCYLGSSEAEFCSALQCALEEPPLGPRASARVQMARSHGWRARMHQIGEILGRAWDTRANLGTVG